MIKASSFITSSQTEIVDGFLFENAPTNWALEINHITGEGRLNGFFKSESEMSHAISNISEDIGYYVEFQFSTYLIEDQDWQESYKQHFSPWDYKGVHFIPFWLKDEYRVPDDEISVLLDPGMAFGTGTHETTRMCLEFLIENNKAAKILHESILDLGCGSGILAITAHLLGFKKVVGLDNDMDAVRISEENAHLNQLTDQILFDCSDLLDLNEPNGDFDCVVANIQADVLIANAKNIVNQTNQKSNIILSGILSKEIDQIINVFKKELIGLSNFDYQLKELGEWSAIQIIKTGSC